MFADHPDMTVLVHEDVEFTWTEEGTIVDLNDRVVNEERDMYRITYLAFDDNLQEYEFSSFTATNTVEGFWRAAESC